MLERIYIHHCFITRQPFTVIWIKWSLWCLQALSPCSTAAVNNRKDVLCHILLFLQCEFNDKNNSVFFQDAW